MWMKAIRFMAAAALAGCFAAEAAEAQQRVVVLSDADQARYQAAFEAIDRHDWADVRTELARVDDNILVQTVRGRMYANRAYRTSYAELNAWLSNNGDLGVAPAVYDRAEDARPHRGRGRRRHAVGPPPVAPSPLGIRTPYGAARQPPGDTGAARVQIENIAQRLASGDIDGARALGESALYGPRSGDANWWLGLVAYRQGDYAQAVTYFEAASAWPYFSTWMTSASNYWAARARIASGQPRGATLHLEAAAMNPYTFYGQLAEEQLGRQSGLHFDLPPLDEGQLSNFFDRRPAARRAAALAQLGRLSDVESELRRLHTFLDPNEDRMFLALAGALDAPSAQLRAAEYGPLELSGGFCPSHAFTPENGFQLDRALVYAIVRQESHFNPVAVSRSNARGLMQLLPSTARDMDPDHNYRRAPAPLFDPGLNMRLGQDYLRWMMDTYHPDHDLGKLFAAYNGGVGWLSRWMATQPAVVTNDPLLLMETLPRPESRDYAERVLAHMGVCRAKFGQERVEFRHLVEGEPARYEAQDNRNPPRVAMR